MTDTIKFTFDTEFEDLDEAERQLRLRPPVDPGDEPRHSDNQLAAAREQAHAEGVEVGIQQAREEGEYISSTALTALSQEMGRINGVHETIVRDAHKEAIGLALIIARKLAAELLVRYPVPEIEAVIKDLLLQLGELTMEPKVVVRVDPAHVQSVQQRIDTLKSQSGFEGQITVVGQEDISGSDCRVEWAEGGGERDAAVIEREIVAAVIRYIDSVEARWQRRSANPEQDAAVEAEAAPEEVSPAQVPQVEATSSNMDIEEPVISTENANLERVIEADEAAELPAMSEVPETAVVPELSELAEGPEIPDSLEVAELTETTETSEITEMPVTSQDASPTAEIEIESEAVAAAPSFVDISVTHEDVGDPDTPTITENSLPPIPSMDDPPEEGSASAADNLPWPAITEFNESEEISLDAPSTTDEIPTLEDAPSEAQSEESNDEQT